jgi:hypothetical protein
MSGEAVEQTREDLIAQFGGLTILPDSVRGVWVHQGARYEDESLRVIVDVDDTPENRQFFLGLKPVLLQRFEQIEIYMVSYAIDVL